MQPESTEEKSKEQLKREAASEAAKDKFSAPFLEALGTAFGPLKDLPNQRIASEEGSPEREKMVNYIQSVLDQLGNMFPRPK